MRGIYGFLIVLAGLLFIATMNDFFFLEIGVLIVIASLVIWTQYSRLKHMKIIKMIIIGMFVAGMVLITSCLFYFVYRPLLDHITFQWLKVITSWILMVLTLCGASLCIHAGIKKLTENN